MILPVEQKFLDFYIDQKTFLHREWLKRHRNIIQTKTWLWLNRHFLKNLKQI